MSHKVFSKLRIISIFILGIITLFFLSYLYTIKNKNTQKTIEKYHVKAQTTSCDAMPNNWPQIGNDSQHTGYSPESLGSNFPTRTWTKPFQPERIYPQVQAIVYCGNVYVGTEDGNLYALKAQSANPQGELAWSQPFHTDGPITSSVAAGNNTIYVVDMHSNLYAVDALSGTQKWKTTPDNAWRYGFFASPVLSLDEGKVFIGRNDGTFYAFNVSDGSVAWEQHIGSPILQTAAYNKADDQVGRVFFGAMNMHNYALDASNGAILWDTGKTSKYAYKDYWPVVFDGKVYNRPMGSPALLALDEKTGTNITPVHQGSGQTMNGATTPPCVDYDPDGSTYLIVPKSYPNSWKSGWGKADINNLDTASPLLDIGGTDIGFGNNDENMNPTCTANYILSMHMQEANANFTGAYHLANRTWTRINSGRTNNQMFSNTQGGGSNPASISNRWIYHISYHEVIARNTN